jgi:hypothetical protein
VHKFARGSWPPPDKVAFDPESVRLCVEWASPEFVDAPDPGAGLPPPLHLDAEPRASRRRQALLAYCGDRFNFQVAAPPAYYALAGAWLRLGRSLDLDERRGAYWVRFLNAPLLAGLVLLAGAFCRRWVREPADARLGVPLLVAFLPQDSFYAITRDVLSPLVCLAGLMLLLDWRGRERPGALRSALVGLATALAALTHLLNGFLALLLAAALLRRARAGDPGSAAAAGAAAPLPVALWCVRNLLLSGDPTGTAAKIEVLGWTPGFAGFGHPLFRAAGAWTFWEGLLVSLWRGELYWHAQRMAHPSLDAFYAIGSTALLAAAAVAALRRRGADAAPVGWLWACFGIPVLALAALSLAFDFSDSLYPSAAHPFFTSGRLAAGALVPFLVLWVQGAAELLRPVALPRAVLCFTALTCLAMAASEALLMAPVFASPYNLFGPG